MTTQESDAGVKPESDAGAKSAVLFLKPGIERVVLIPPQKNPARLAEALAAGLDAIDQTNADLSPKEQKNTLL